MTLLMFWTLLARRRFQTLRSALACAGLTATDRVPSVPTGTGQRDEHAGIRLTFVGAVFVLGPVIADHRFGRRYWGGVLACLTVGTIVGGLLALRVWPRYPLRFGMACTAVLALIPLVLGLHPVVGLLAAAGLLTGLGLEQFGVAWSVTMQHQIPTDRLARAYSYDMLGSFVAIPIGEVAVGPLSHAFGLRTTLVGAAGIILVAMLAALASRSVRDLTNT